MNRRLTPSVAALAIALPLVFAMNAGAQENKQLPQIVVIAGSEDAEGVTQKDFDLSTLKVLENRTLDQLKTKMQNYLRSQGEKSIVSKLTSESNYIELGKFKLAVVRIKAQAVNQVFVFGIKGQELKRVACARTTKFEESIPLSYGPCGEKIQEVFGVGLGS
jgi:hypothetical protein